MVFLTFKIAHDRVKLCCIGVLEVISERKFQTGVTFGQEKNLWVEFWVGWLQRVQAGDCIFSIFKSLSFVRQVFLRILYWRSLASINFDVVARV